MHIKIVHNFYGQPTSQEFKDFHKVKDEVDSAGLVHYHLYDKENSLVKRIILQSKNILLVEISA